MLPRSAYSVKSRCYHGTRHMLTQLSELAQTYSSNARAPNVPADAASSDSHIWLRAGSLLRQADEEQGAVTANFHTLTAEGRLSDGAIEQARQQTAVPEGGVKSWLMKPFRDPNRDFLKNGHASKLSILNNEIEGLVYKQVVKAIKTHKLVTAKGTQQIARQLLRPHGRMFMS